MTDYNELEDARVRRLWWRVTATLVIVGMAVLAIALVWLM